jgi:hypothetical protein
MGLHGVVASLSLRRIRGDRYPYRSPDYGEVILGSPRRSLLSCRPADEVGVERYHCLSPDILE